MWIRTPRFIGARPWCNGRASNRGSDRLNTLADDVVAASVDIAFPVQGTSVPREHRRALAEALQAALPWFGDARGAGVHRLNVSAGGGPQALLSRRTRLTLRVPRARMPDVAVLEGVEFRLGAGTLRLGAPQPHELLPHGTLYAHFVVAADDADEAAFLRAMQAELDALDVACRAICGRHQVVEDGLLQGFSLMLDGLSPGAALRVLEMGLGPHRRLGCGLFVPHKSAAAVVS